LRGVGAIDAQDQVLGSRADELLLALEHLWRGRKLVELTWIDGDGMAGREDPAAVVLRGAIDKVPLGPDDVDARAPEVLAPAIGVEPDDVVGKQPIVEGDANGFRQHT